MKKPHLSFNPYNGVPLGPETRRLVEAWRAPPPQGMKDEPWLFNPWTGQERDSADVASDPKCLCVMLPGEDMIAAPMQPPPPAFLNAVATAGLVASELDAGEPESFTPAGDPQYGMLYAVLMEAFAQASTGKGKERHANDLPFTAQKIFSINRQLGSVDGILYQIVKKTIESKKLPPDRACAELMGAIVYAAAGILVHPGAVAVIRVRHYDELPGGMSEPTTDRMLLDAGIALPPEFLPALERRRRGCEHQGDDFDLDVEILALRQSGDWIETLPENEREAITVPWYYPEAWTFWRVLIWFGGVCMVAGAIGWIWGR